MSALTFHLIANAHLDPVWLWDWREGLNEGLTTVRSVLNLMDERPELTFIRGESAIYQFIERQDPALFERIRAYVAAGRWDVVGGTYIQPDMNMPSTGTLLRHFTVAGEYFRSRFGQAPKVGWSPDPFGHSAGLPEILAAAGMESYAFMRPQPHALTLDSPVFWWRGAGGARILAYRNLLGWYGCDRAEIFERMDQLVAESAKYPMRNVGCYYGVGNHGGGPTRRQLDDIALWARQHPEVEVVHSGLHRFFAALREEEAGIPGGFPEHTGEINFCLRGCYASLARFKFPYRRTEAHLPRAEATDSIIAARLDRPARDLTAAWESVLFNSFHDILPGSSIERAYSDQLAWLGVAEHGAHETELTALNALAAAVDTTVPVPGEDLPCLVPVLAWNPHPAEYRGPLELEVSIDYRPVWKYRERADETPLTVLDPDGKALDFQVIRTEHSSMPGLPWRFRVVLQTSLPPMGWKLFRMGLGDDAEAGKPVIARRNDELALDNAGGDGAASPLRISADGRQLQVVHEGRALFPGDGVSLVLVEDPWGSWGGMEEEPDSLDLSKVLENWRVARAFRLEEGPQRSTYWVRFAGASSRADFTISLCPGRPVAEVSARVFFNERSARLKMAFPSPSGQVRYEVPGGTVMRGPLGEVPGGRWAVFPGDGGLDWGFASDALYGFDQAPGAFRATIVRASRYANDVFTPAGEEPWRPAVDAGELCFRFAVTPETAALPRLARELEQPPILLPVQPSPGTLPREGSLLGFDTAGAQLISLRPANQPGAWLLEVQEIVGESRPLTGSWLGESMAFGVLEAYRIQTFKLEKQGGAWGSTAID